MKKPIAIGVSAALVAVFSVGLLAGCGGKRLVYHEYLSEADEMGDAVIGDYDHNTFYQNDLTTLGADPSAIYVSEGEEKGYYYMYTTSDPIGATGYLAYRSKNLNDWECVGVAYNPTLYINTEGGKEVTYTSFATSMYWAPEVIYDAEMGMYLMFYNASYIFQPYRFFIDVAVSESPRGPFVQYAKWKYDNGTEEEKTQWAPVTDNTAADRAGLGAGNLKVYQPLLDFSRVPAGTEIDESWQKGDKLREGELPGYMKVIDASPFIDEDGEKYLYFVQDLGDNIHATSAICVIKMNDDWTPDYTQTKKLTVANQYKIDDNRSDFGYADLGEGSVNEAPFMVRHGNKYYLMFSANSYTSKSYSVRVAVGDSPMGPFTKLKREEGGWLLYSDGEWASGTGHHSFVSANGSTFIVYHAHTDRKLGGGARAIAFDEVTWVEGNGGYEVPHVNGPTYSYMPLITSEWRNIAGEATVKSTNVLDGSDVKYLTDGVIKIHDDTDFVKEFEMKEGKATITLEFEDYREITGLVLVNSYAYELSVESVEKVVFNTDGKKVSTGTLEFDYNRYYPWEEYYVAGGTFAIQFAPMRVKSITITLPKMQVRESETETEFAAARALSEIMVLGK